MHAEKFRHKELCLIKMKNENAKMQNMNFENLFKNYFNDFPKTQKYHHTKQNIINVTHDALAKYRIY